MSETARELEDKIDELCGWYEFEQFKKEATHYYIKETPFSKTIVYVDMSTTDE